MWGPVGEAHSSRDRPAAMAPSASCCYRSSHDHGRLSDEWVPATLSMISTRSTGSIGFVKYSSKPAANARSLSSGFAYAVAATAVTALPAVWLRMYRMSSRPSRPGIPRSQIITSGSAFSKDRIASYADVTHVTLAPCCNRIVRKSSQVSGLSSTTSRCNPESRADGVATPSVLMATCVWTPSGVRLGLVPRRSSTVKVAPLPWPSLLAHTVPPCRSTRCRTIERPSPNPP